MKLPFKSDPSRPFESALRSTRMVGMASVLVGMGVLIVGYFFAYRQFSRFFIGAGMIVWFMPGLAYLTTAYYLARRVRGAAVAAIVVAAVQLAFGVVAFTANFFLTPISPVPILVTALWVVGLIELIVQLRRCLRASQSDAEVRRGFEAVVVRPVMPVNDDDGGNGRARPIRESN